MSIEAGNEEAEVTDSIISESLVYPRTLCVLSLSLPTSYSGLTLPNTATKKAQCCMCLKLNNSVTRVGSGSNFTTYEEHCRLESYAV
jgi:hypothetical protein